MTLRARVYIMVRHTFKLHTKLCVSIVNLREYNYVVKRPIDSNIGAPYNTEFKHRQSLLSDGVLKLMEESIIEWKIQLHCSSQICAILIDSVLN
jgi:hypothetical protein